MRYPQSIIPAEADFANSVATFIEFTPVPARNAFDRPVVPSPKQLPFFYMSIEEVF
jgi:hypothetical protein